MNDTLSPQSIEAITGYKRPAEQLQELRAQGFYRARLGPVDGKVILERPHYEHICAGGGKPANDAQARPQVRAAR
ncbi:DUF4224 domain-containing protein [Variovorax sp. LjRoot175]|uniref:DUF4224 domain-containing protein n=1 Tax=Variovorax sp. LjRoot175 TaxID=3342276 RepID=UPI003ECE6F63